MVFRFAIATGRATRDPSADLRGALITPTVKHHAAIVDPIGMGDLLRSIDGLENSFVVKSALRLAPLVFVRPGEFPLETRQARCSGRVASASQLLRIFDNKQFFRRQTSTQTKPSYGTQRAI
jgi:hypothetical protein